MRHILNNIDTFNYLQTTRMTYQILHSFITSCIMFEWDLVHDNPLNHQKIVTTILHCIKERIERVKANIQFFVLGMFYQIMCLPCNHDWRSINELFDINCDKNYLNMKGFLPIFYLTFLKLIDSCSIRITETIVSSFLSGLSNQISSITQRGIGCQSSFDGVP